MIRSSQWSLVPSARRLVHHAPRIEHEESTIPAEPVSVVPTGAAEARAAHPRDAAELFAPPAALASSTPAAGEARESSAAFAAQAAAAATTQPVTFTFPARPGSTPVRPPWAGRPRQRIDMRKPVRLAVELVRRGTERPAGAIGANLSSTGAYIVSDAEFLPLEHVVVNFRLPWSGAAYSFFAEVIHVEHLPHDLVGASHGFGVEFLDASAADRASLREALRALPS
jgi:hypothetical protein